MKSVGENVIKTVDVTSVLLRPSVCEYITSRELFMWGGRRGHNYAFEFIYLSSDQYFAITLLFAVRNFVFTNTAWVELARKRHSEVKEYTDTGKGNY